MSCAKRNRWHRRIRFSLLTASALAGIYAADVSATDTHDAPTTITLPGAQVFPESITSTSDGTVYIGSLGEGGVLRAAAGARHAVPFIHPGSFESHSIFGVLADERSGTLWACSNDLSERGIRVGRPPPEAGHSTESPAPTDSAPSPGAAPSREPAPSTESAQAPGTSTASADSSPQGSGSALLAFDLKSGHGKLRVTLPGEHPLCNDVAIGPDGSAYVTDMLAGQILRLKHGTHAFEVWSADPQFLVDGTGSLDGIAFGGDGNLYVDTFTTGRLYRITVHNGVAAKVTRMTLSRPLANPDGLRLVAGDSFVLVEGAGRLDRVRVNDTHATIDTIKDGYAGPTGVTLQSGTAWVSEGQLGIIFDPARKGQAPHLPFKAYAVDVVQ